MAELPPPTAELLLSVRTPAELAVAPDERSIAFALHPTVADAGSFVPSDVYRLGSDATEPVALTARPWSDRTPAWSSDGSRLAFLSDRLTPGHFLPYVLAGEGGEPELAATLSGSAESVSWSSDGTGLLVLAADPGSYGLDWSARAVNGAQAPADPIVRRPGDARRRLFLVDVATASAAEVGPPDRSVWEVDWDGEDLVVAIVSSEHSGSGWYQGWVARLDLEARAERPLYRPRWQLEGLGLAPDGGARRPRRGLRQ
jgi:dipeptidyl aminopeptidase/acylaminoacyl peptidase